MPIICQAKKENSFWSLLLGFRQEGAELIEGKVGKISLQAWFFYHDNEELFPRFSGFYDFRLQRGAPLSGLTTSHRDIHNLIPVGITIISVSVME
jgi:hypothetical protein